MLVKKEYIKPKNQEAYKVFQQILKEHKEKEVVVVHVVHVVHVVL
jgi:hypothetical protein